MENPHLLSQTPSGTRPSGRTQGRRVGGGKAEGAGLRGIIVVDVNQL